MNVVAVVQSWMNIVGSTVAFRESRENFHELAFQFVYEPTQSPHEQEMLPFTSFSFGWKDYLDFNPKRDVRRKDYGGTRDTSQRRWRIRQP
jgi:hypothetical protein